MGKLVDPGTGKPIEVAEAEHFMRCPSCGGWIDCRDLGQVFDREPGGSHPKAHRRGVCFVAVYQRDIAETKATRATEAGRSKGYPLMFTTEPEE
jgi:hypothetical protein